MTLTVARDRMISFRISSSEYDKLRECCLTQGVRSISELARAAVNKAVRESGAAEGRGLEKRVGELERRLWRMASEMNKLKQSVI